MRRFKKKDVKFVDTCYDRPLQDNAIIVAVLPVVEIYVLKEVIQDYCIHNYGPRCKEYNSDCVVCACYDEVDKSFGKVLKYE